MLDQIRTCEIESLSGEVLGLDQLLVGASAALGRRRVRQLPPTGLIGHDRACKPPAGHNDTAGEPVRDPSRGLAGGLSFGRDPDHPELSPRHPDVLHRYPRQVSGGTVTEESLEVRRVLGRQGVVTVVVLVDPDTGQLTEPPDYLTHGFAHDEQGFDGATPAIEKALSELSGPAARTAARQEQAVAAAVSMWIRRVQNRAPVVVVVLVDA